MCTLVGHIPFLYKTSTKRPKLSVKNHVSKMSDYKICALYNTKPLLDNNNYN